MNLYSCIKALEKIAITHPSVNETGNGNIYEFANANPTLKYACYFISQTNHREDEYFSYYGFNIFYFDRLIDDLETNRLQIQSIGKDVIVNTLKLFVESFIGSTYTQLNFQPFTQRFSDLTAGIYCTVQLKVPKAIICSEDFKELVVFTGSCEDCYKQGYEDGLQQDYQDGFESGVTYQKSKLESITITENGTYSKEDGYSEIVVDVESNCDGIYESGWTNGYISGNTDGFDEGYFEGLADCSAITFDEGFESGVTYQKLLLIDTAITVNGRYETENGYGSVVVNVPQTGYTEEDLMNYYQSGKTDGIDYQKSLLTGTAFTENGTYTSPENGYSAVTVNVAQTGYTQADLDAAYDSGVTSGITYQKSLLANTAFTENGTYLRNDGWSAVTVNVSGYSQEDLDAAYLSGYSAGLEDCSGSTPTDYNSEPLTFEILSSGNWYVTLGMEGNVFQYSKNKGAWTDINYSVIVPVEEGDIIQVRGENLTHNVQSRHMDFASSTCSYNVYGNIMSLAHPTNFIGLTLTSGQSFEALFLSNTNLVSAENLILPKNTTQYCYRHMFQNCTNLIKAPELPANILSIYCYSEMFTNCTSLTKSPDLPAASLTTYCYYSMFANCSNLNQVKCLAIAGVNTDGSTRDWLDYVSSTGTFTKHPDMNVWPTNYNGIPSTWTVIDAS